MLIDSFEKTISTISQFGTIDDIRTKTFAAGILCNLASSQKKNILAQKVVFDLVRVFLETQNDWIRAIAIRVLVHLIPFDTNNAIQQAGIINTLISSINAKDRTSGEDSLSLITAALNRFILKNYQKDLIGRSGKENEEMEQVNLHPIHPLIFLMGAGISRKTNDTVKIILNLMSNEDNCFFMTDSKNISILSSMILSDQTQLQSVALEVLHCFTLKNESMSAMMERINLEKWLKLTEEKKMESLPSDQVPNGASSTSSWIIPLETFPNFSHIILTTDTLGT
jgi:hypothetical protein